MLETLKKYFRKEESPGSKAVEIDLDKLIENTTYFQDILFNSRSLKEHRKIPLDYRLVIGMPVRLEEGENFYNDITAKKWKDLIKRIDKITDTDMPDCLHTQSFGYNFKDGSRDNGCPLELKLFGDLCLIGGRIAKILGDKERSAVFCKRGYNALRYTPQEQKYFQELASSLILDD